MIDGKLSYKQYVQYACDRASAVSVVLARMMPNERVDPAFRTVSDDDAFVISGLMLNNILADEMTNISNIRSTSSLSQTKKAEGEKFLNR